MKINIDFKMQNYFHRIFLIISIAIVLVVMILSAIVYYNVDSSVMVREYQNNQKILSQVKYNIETLNSMVINICLSTFRSNDTIAIMYNKEDDNNLIDFVKSMDRLKNIVQTNSFVRSICIYNNNNNRYYSSSDYGIYSREAELDELVGNLEAIPKLVPVLQKLKVEGQDGRFEDVFRYFMYDNLDKNNKGGMLIVNVKASWVFENIYAINDIDRTGEDLIFLLDSQGGFISNNSENSILERALKTSYESEKYNTGIEKASGLFTFKVENRLYTALYTKIEKTGWVVLKVQSVNAVYGYKKRLMLSILIICAVFILIAFLISIPLSKRIYKPLGHLVRQISEKQPRDMSDAARRNEFEFLRNVYNRNLDKLTDYESERRSNKEIIKTYFLRKILLDSTTFSTEEIAKAGCDYNLLLSESDNLSVCLLRIDDYKDYYEKYSPFDRELFKFAIINVATEVVAGKYKNEAVDMKNDQIVIILNPDEGNNFYDEVSCLIREVQEFIHENFDISFSASISEMIPGARELTKAYNTAMNNSMYRYVLGKKSIIVPRDIGDNNKNLNFGSLLSIEKNLVNEIKTGNPQRVKECLNSAFTEISKYSYGNITFSVMYIINIVNNCFCEIQQMNIKPTKSDMNSLIQEFYEYETIDMLKQKLYELVDKFSVERKCHDDDKKSILVDAVINIIDSNYHDSGFGLQQMSDILKVSSTYIGRIFKENIGMTIPEYINEVRMNRALELLDKSKLAINEISVKVGIENVTYFYKVFKKRFGVAPKEYVIKKSVDSVE